MSSNSINRVEVITLDDLFIDHNYNHAIYGKDSGSLRTRSNEFFIGCLSHQTENSVDAKQIDVIDITPDSPDTPGAVVDPDTPRAVTVPPVKDLVNFGAVHCTAIPGSFTASSIDVVNVEDDDSDVEIIEEKSTPAVNNTMPASTPIRRKHLDEILCDVAQESHTLHSPSPARKQQSYLNSMKTSKNKKIISEICNQFDNTSERLYSCQQCQFECRNLYDLEVHKIDHVRSNVYVCSVCDKQYVMKSYYISHLGLHFKCSSSSSSNNKGFTINHQTNSKRYFYIKCKFCEKVFASTAALDKHKKSHFGKNSPQGFEKMSGEKNKGSVEGAKQKIGLKRKSTDSEYSSNGNRGNLFGCNVCKETFRDGEKLENHIKSVHRNGNKNARSRNFEEVLQVWSETSLSSSSSSSSDPSVITCISDSSDTSDLCSSNDPLKLYKCRYCSNDYYHMKSLKKHMMTAHDDNCPYFCSNCNTAFHMKNDLKFHQGHCRLSNIQPATSSNIPTTTTTVAAASVSDNSNKSKPNFKLRINLIYNPKNSYADCL